MRHLGSSLRSAVTAIGLTAAMAIVPLHASFAEGGFNLPAGAKFSADKLERIGRFLKNEIASGKIPGAAFLISHNGKPVYSKMFGVRDVETQFSMSPDTIFRIHSMSKVITSVAAMMLIDEGKIRLDDPVAKYIPAFAEAKVGTETESEGGKELKLAPPKRPVTVRDLMRHTAGITYGFYGDSLVRKAYTKAEIYKGDFDNAEFAERLAKLPLAEEPGTLWNYGHSTDVLARVIEVASGQSLYQFQKQRLLDPLKMVDTKFYIDPADFSRFAEPMPNDSDFRVGRKRSPREPMKWESGSGGMVSTLNDFSRFCQMLLNRGALDGKTYLSPATFDLMVSDQVGPTSGIARDYFYFPGDGFGFGLGFAVRTDPGHAKPPPPGSLGEIKWDGASGTYFVIDFKQNMFFLLMQQSPSERQRIQRTIKQLVYDALAN